MISTVPIAIRPLGYLHFVDRAMPVTDPTKLQEIQAAQLRYLRYRAENDPARGMFNRFYGTDWTEEYIRGFLFDLERQLPLAQPQRSR